MWRIFTKIWIFQSFCWYTALSGISWFPIYDEKFLKRSPTKKRFYWLLEDFSWKEILLNSGIKCWWPGDGLNCFPKLKFCICGLFRFQAFHTRLSIWYHLYDVRILWMENLVGWSQLSGAIYWKLFRPLLLLPLQEVAEWRQGGERFSKALLIRRWGGRGIVNFNLLLPKRSASPLPPALLLLFLLRLPSPPRGVRKGSHVFPIGRRAGLLLFQ